MNLLSVILSSALVSGVISILVTSFFENKKYIKNKKFSTYDGFLSQLDKIVPVEVVAGLYDDQLIEKVQIECARLERFVWQIKLVSKNEIINEKSEKIFRLASKLSKIIEKKWDKPDFNNKIREIFEETNTKRDELITEMRKDINKLI